MTIQFDWDFGDEEDAGKRGETVNSSTRRPRPDSLTAGQGDAYVRRWLGQGLGSASMHSQSWPWTMRPFPHRLSEF